MNYYQTKKQPSESPVNLSDWDAKELRIVKQAILKSAIEGQQICRPEGESEEAFLERWIKWTYRNEEKDKNLTEQANPF